MLLIFHKLIMLWEGGSLARCSPEGDFNLWISSLHSVYTNFLDSIAPILNNYYLLSIFESVLTIVAYISGETLPVQSYYPLNIDILFT